MAVCRGVGWQELVRPAVVPGGQNRRVGQQPRQIAVRIQPTFFRRFNHAVDHGAALCAPRRVGEEKILPANHKGFYGTFGKVVAQLQPRTLQIRLQFLSHSTHTQSPSQCPNVFLSLISGLRLSILSPADARAAFLRSIFPYFLFRAPHSGKLLRLIP